MSLINVTANGSTLVKTSGCGGCADASAISEQQINGNGSVSFTAPESGSLRIVGLASGGIGTGAGDLGFAIRLQAGTAEVREYNGYKTETSFAAGDTFSISVSGGAVQYAKNGAVFYTSGSQASSAVRLHAIFFDSNAAIANVAFAGAAGGSSVAGPAPATAAPGTRYAKDRPAGQTPVRRKK
jgi:hypothetical protein